MPADVANRLGADLEIGKLSADFRFLDFRAAASVIDYLFENAKAFG